MPKHIAWSLVVRGRSKDGSFGNCVCVHKSLIHTQLHPNLLLHLPLPEALPTVWSPQYLVKSLVVLAPEPILRKHLGFQNHFSSSNNFQEEKKYN